MARRSKGWLSTRAMQVQIRALSLPIECPREGFLSLFPGGFKFLIGIMPSVVWELSEATHIGCLAEDITYVNTPSIFA